MYLESVTQINAKQSGLSLGRTDVDYSALIHILLKLRKILYCSHSKLFKIVAASLESSFTNTGKEERMGEN